MLATLYKTLMLSAMLVTFTGCASLAQQQASGQVTATSTPREYSYRVQPGDRLVDIALALTGDTSNWRVIADYNNITEPKTLASGSVLRIPGELNTDPVIAANTSVKPNRQTTAGSGGAPPVTTGTGVVVANSASPLNENSGEVALHTVQVNRSFDKTPLNTPMISEFARLNAQVHASRLQASQVRVLGTYVPVGIYKEPTSGSQLLARVAPGSLFKLQGKIYSWYKITTADGTGYIRQSDGALVK